MWPAKLRGELPRILELKSQLSTGEKGPVEAIEYLESLAADTVVPHHWLHHSSGGHQYYYGGRDDH